MAAQHEAATRPKSADILPEPDDKHRYVREMFDAIAPRYDLLNSVLSLRLHHRWRTAAVRATSLKPGDHALDVCTGTGDLAFALAKRVGPSGNVDATDFSEPMLDLARHKARAQATAASIRFQTADTQDLPFPENTFDAVTVAFGIRNVADIDQGLREMVRVAKPGGRIVVLEFNQPRHPVLRALSDFYSFAILPRIGGLVSGRRSAYTYLPASVAAFHSRDTLVNKMRDAGLEQIAWKDLNLGMVVLHQGVKT
jgi:demethylmenaquinone methyltransferase/2-methoxy-6-polyprenyl-1,4-benzoquinol methylase